MSKKNGTFGHVTSKLSDIWISRLGSTSALLPEANVQAMFNDLNLFPSKSQVFEMVRCARESSCVAFNNSLEPAVVNTDFLTFGEFCIFATELSRHYAAAFGHAELFGSSKCLPMANGSCVSGNNVPGSGCSLANRKTADLHRSPPPKAGSSYDVFLGGSCNPTTWRQDVAIPYFKSQGITYYNPQQSNWVPEMIELEYQAKQTSKILFFVLNEMTRNIVSMIEVSFMSGHRRKLIVMINPYPGSGHTINGEKISDMELNDLESALATVHDLVERQGAPVFSSLSAAMACATKVIKDHVAIEDLGLSDNAQPVKLAHVQIGDSLVRLREAFDTLDTSRIGKLSMADLAMAFRIHTQRDLSQRDLRSIESVLDTTKTIGNNNTNHSNGNSTNDPEHITFEDFCKIVSEFQLQVGDHKLPHPKLWDNLANKTVKFFRCIIHPITGRHRRHLTQAEPRTGIRENSLTRTFRDRRGSSVRDIYLGGSMDPLNKWRDNIAIPLLKKNGLTFFNPQTSTEAMALYSRRLLPIEAGAMDNSRCLLFVILGASLSVKAMCEAAYQIGLGKNIVLCIEPMPCNLTIGDAPLSCDAMKDYSRGRAYLSDIANREKVPIFDNIHEAVTCVIQKCKTLYEKKEN